MNVCFITSNRDKLREFEQILGFKLGHAAIDIDEIQELDSDKIAEHKAKQAYEKLKKPLIVSDESVYIDCLNGFPGPLIKWFWTRVTLERICGIANFFNNHKITAKTTITYYDGNEIRHFYGIVNGEIPEEPTGKNGFGWDAIFIPDGFSRTFAEMTAEEKNKVSMRRKAIEEFRKFISKDWHH